MGKIQTNAKNSKFEQNLQTFNSVPTFMKSNTIIISSNPENQQQLK